MEIRIRPVRPEDAEACGRIIYEAFKGVNERHGFRPDFPSAEAATQLVRHFIGDPSVFGLVAESGDRVVGSNFLSEWDAVRSVGPITVEPGLQARGTGRRLMEAVVERGRGAACIRLVQDSFNTASLSLYASLGFEVKEPLALMEGRTGGELPAGYEVRPMRDEDLGAVAELCRRVHGFERNLALAHLEEVQEPNLDLRADRSRRVHEPVARQHGRHNTVVGHAVFGREALEGLESLDREGGEHFAVILARLLLAAQV